MHPLEIVTIIIAITLVIIPIILKITKKGLLKYFSSLYHLLWLFVWHNIPKSEIVQLTKNLIFLKI